MKNIFILLILLFSISLVYSQDNKKTTNSAEDYEKSFKEQKDSGALPKYSEHLDSANNLYSNFKYNLAFDAPNNWQSDAGVSEHTIIRFFQRDSAITFAINVIEIKGIGKEVVSDIWKMYQVNKEKMDYPLKVLIPKQYNSKAEDFISSKTYLMNKVTLKRKFKYLVRELDLEYYITSIVYQTIIGNLSYTFSLNVPTMFYNENPDFYDSLFVNIRFLVGKEEINNYLNKDRH